MHCELGLLPHGYKLSNLHIINNNHSQFIILSITVHAVICMKFVKLTHMDILDNHKYIFLNTTNIP